MPTWRRVRNTDGASLSELLGASQTSTSASCKFSVEAMDSANSPNPSRPMETEDNLVDEKLSPTPDFKGATLELDSAARNGNDPDVQFGGMGNNEAGEYPGRSGRLRFQGIQF